MAIGKKSFLYGKVTGQVGGIVSSIDRAGRVIIRQSPEAVANPRTSAQTAQRKKFAYINALASVSPGLVTRFFGTTSETNPLHTPRNRFMSLNLKRDVLIPADGNFAGTDVLWGGGAKGGFLFSGVSKAEDGTIANQFNLIGTITPTDGEDDDQLILFVQTSEGALYSQPKGQRDSVASPLSFSLSAVDDTNVSVFAAYVPKEEHDRRAPFYKYFEDVREEDIFSEVYCIYTDVNV